MDDFITKDSGVRKEYDSGMRRDSTTGKPTFDLLLPEGQDYNSTMLHRWACLMGRGAEKYGNRNWELANSEEEMKRFKASAMRHFMQWFSGEVDEDHAAAIMFNVNAAEYLKWKMSIETNEFGIENKIKGISMVRDTIDGLGKCTWILTEKTLSLVHNDFNMTTRISNCKNHKIVSDKRDELRASMLEAKEDNKNE